MPRKRRYYSDDDVAAPNINSSSSSSFSTSSSLVRDCLTADIDASTAKYLLELKANREQAVMARAAELEAMKQKEHDLTVQSQREKLRHQQKLAENQQAQHQLIEKAEDDLLFQSRAEVARKALSSRQKRLDWAHETEKDDYAEKQRRDAQEWEDRRQIKLKHLKKVEEREDARLRQEEQDAISRQTYERDMNKVVVMDINSDESTCNKARTNYYGFDFHNDSFPKTTTCCRLMTVTAIQTHDRELNYSGGVSRFQSMNIDVFHMIMLRTPATTSILVSKSLIAKN